MEGLGVNGKLIVLGIPADQIEVSATQLIMARRSISGWPAGTSIDSQDALAFSVATGVRPMTEAFPLERAAEAYEHMMSGGALKRDARAGRCRADGGGLYFETCS